MLDKKMSINNEEELLKYIDTFGAEEVPYITWIYLLEKDKLSNSTITKYMDVITREIFLGHSPKAADCEIADNEFVYLLDNQFINIYKIFSINKYRIGKNPRFWKTAIHKGGIVMEAVVNTMNPMVNWSIISECTALSNDFIHRHINELNMTKVSRCHSMSLEFIEEFEDRLDYSELMFRGDSFYNDEDYQGFLDIIDNHKKDIDIRTVAENIRSLQDELACFDYYR